ncbi:oxidoreductase [Marmoricola endophyticus]|uniref:Oxidoreductase n=1 Tax=Marmoricola endophyticus TaxID=2040280 RepID=A0A917F0J9_9ACTN|nr:alpha/beta fold hydrolase [Marmoricola endophyticus]GGF40298.1 oxidoreductase [Marmoricola endophyticus]
MHTSTLEWNGRRIAWSRAGKGPPVVFVHGTPFSARVWSPYAAELSRTHTVFAWDLPGYGESSKDPAHAVDFTVHARALAALLEHWGVERPHVVAHDFGGGVALRTHLVEEVPYASLLLVDAVVVPPSGSAFFRLVADHPDVLGRLPAPMHRAVVEAYVAGAVHHPLTAEQRDALVAPWTGESGQAAFYRQIAGYDEGLLAENERRLGALGVPTRVLWGAEDAWMPLPLGRRLHGLLDAAAPGGAGWRVIEGAGHLVQYDAPVALMSELRDWLATC